MKIEDKEFFDNQLKLFETQGWKFFQDDLLKQLEMAINSAPTSCGTNDEWQQRRGNIESLRYVSNWELLIREQFKNMEADNEAYI